MYNVFFSNVQIFMLKINLESDIDQKNYSKPIFKIQHSVFIDSINSIFRNFFDVTYFFWLLNEPRLSNKIASPYCLHFSAILLINLS